jgi:hypothetical protein
MPSDLSAGKPIASREGRERIVKVVSISASGRKISKMRSALKKVQQVLADRYRVIERLTSQDYLFRHGALGRRTGRQQ